jgi:hypothetical protein
MRLWFLAGSVGAVALLTSILPHPDLTDELANLSIFTKKHEKDSPLACVRP